MAILFVLCNVCSAYADNSIAQLDEGLVSTPQNVSVQTVAPLFDQRESSPNSSSINNPEISGKKIQVAMLIAMLGMAGIYSFSIYIQNRKNRAPLWLLLSCLSFYFFYIFGSGLFSENTLTKSGNTYSLNYKLAYIALNFSGSFILLFYNCSFPGYLTKKLLNSLLLVSSLLSLALLLATQPILNPLFLVLSLYLCSQFVIGLWILGCARNDKKHYAKPMIFAVLPILLTGPFDLYNFITAHETPVLTLYALIFFVFVESLIIGKKLARALNLAERLSNNLKEEVTLQTAALRKQNKMLERTQAALQLSNSELKKLSITDGLTRVFNRMHFDHEFRKEWRRCARQSTSISILMIDADHFKKLNDSAGHLVGDRCLKAIAKQLYNHFKRAGELVARYGGEEFVVMLPDTNQRKSLALAEGVRTAIERTEINYNGQQYKVTVSIGISTTTPFGNNTPEHLLAAADAALYEAKRQGRNRTAMIPLLPVSKKSPPRQHHQ
jgi:diguanylate cyclase (GGDEF)-like protein